MIPKPTATPSFDESTPLPAPAIGSEYRGLENFASPKESMLDKLKVKKAVNKPMIRKNIERVIFNLFIMRYLYNFDKHLTTLPITRRPEQQCRLKRQSQRFSKLHLSFFASAVCNNVN
jgi:hypothetical protein